MISELKIVGLKSIHQLELKCRPLNLLIGTNSSGKSTILQGLLLVAQNIEKPVGLNGKLVALGNYREAVCVQHRDKIQIDIKGEGDRCALIAEEETYNKNQIMMFWGKRTLTDLLNYENQRFQYLSCQRIGAQDLYRKNLNDETKLGVYGEYAADYLMKHGADPLENKLCRYKASITLASQVNWWMEYIVGAGIQVEDLPGTDYVKVMYRTNLSDAIRPKNIGSGNSYLMGILVMLLASQRGDILVIENPEIHLHPSSQSRLCELLYLMADSGRQIFVESHSDHIFNGIRAGIARGDMDKEKIAVDFLSLDENLCTQNMVVEIGKRGKILNQEKYLFDQFDRDLERMLGID